MARVVGGSGVGRRVRGGERKKVTVGVDKDCGCLHESQILKGMKTKSG